MDLDSVSRSANEEFFTPLCVDFCRVYSHKGAPSEEPEYLSIRLDLPLHLKFDLRLHENELILYNVGLQVAVDLDECFAGLFNLVLANELARRVWHEGRQPNEEDDAPGNLNAQGKTPLYLTVWCVPACHAHPVAHHSPEADAASGDSTDESAVCRR